MNDPMQFPFESEFVDAAGQVAMASMTTALLLMTGPPAVGESPAAWRRRLETSGSELMNSILLAVEARRSVMTAAAEEEAATESRQ